MKDPSGALIPSVKLTLTNTDTNARLGAVTNTNGEFQFLQLPPANYSLTAENPGFKRATVSSILVQVDQVTHVEVALEVGNVSESVMVEAVAPLLESDKSTISSVVDTRTIANMPLNARQYLDLALLTPGAVPSQPGQQGGGFNVAGARSQSNNFLLDGVSNIDTQIGSPLGNFRITDAVQEFAVQTSVPTAEFGRGHGAQVSIVTKSGTNQFHGSVFEYLRNSNFDAADFFTNKLKGTKNTLHRNQYGATFGGPIRKDKTFIFGSWEGFRQVNPTVSATRVPTDAERATVTDPISKALLKFWPSPNGTGTTNYIANVAANTFDNSGILKIDHRFSDRDVISGRWAEYRGTAVTAGVLPQLGGTSNLPVSRSLVLTETHTFNQGLLNEFRFGFSRNETMLTVQDSGFNAASVITDASGKPLAGVVDGTKNLLDSGLPTITVSGGYAVLGTANNYPQGRTTNTYELFDNHVLDIALWGFAALVPFRVPRATRGSPPLPGRLRARYVQFPNLRRFCQRPGQHVHLLHRIQPLLLAARSVRHVLAGHLQGQDQPHAELRLALRVSFGDLPDAPAGTNFVPGVGPVLLGSNQVLNIDPAKKGAAAFVLYAGAVRRSATAACPRTKTISHP